MAKINPMSHIDSFNGKYAQTDQVYTKIRKFDERTIGVRLKHPSTNQPPSAVQATYQSRLADVSKQVSLILADATQRAIYKAAWKKQKKCSSLNGYIFSQLYHAEPNDGGQNNG